MILRLVSTFALAAGLVLPVLAKDAQTIPVILLDRAPTVDGGLDDWGGASWLKVPIAPAVSMADRQQYGLVAEDNNYTGKITVQIKVGVYDGRFYLAARWPDDAANVDYKGWDWRGDRYVESKKREDMFAVRFHLDGDFDRSMLSEKTYRVDVWLWSAARTDPLGLAEDQNHSISNKEIEDAAEYTTQGKGTLYIKKQRDAGSPLYQPVRPPKEKGAEHLPGIKLSATPSGSIADVRAKGVWKSGYWNLELSRALDTGNPDDAKLRPGQKILGQIAVFNRSSNENKSISEPLIFDLGKIQ